MKKYKEQFANRMRYIAFGVLAIIAVLAFATDWQTAAGITTAMALVVGSITLEGKEEELYNALKSTIDSALEKTSKGYITADKAGELIADKLKEFKINLKDDEDFKLLKAALEAHGLQLKAYTETGAGSKYKSTAEQMREQIAADKSGWADFVTGKSQKFPFSISKQAGTINISHSAGSWQGQPEYEPGLTDIMRQQALVIPLLNVAGTNSATITYVQKINPDGAATLVNDTTIAPLVDFDIATASSTAVDYADAIKVHTNMLDDIDFMAGEIDKELRYQVDIVADNAVLSALIAASPAFTLTGLEVKTPNNFDCIMACATQIEAGFGTANLALVNPVDYANMIMSKDSDGGYVLPPFQTGLGTTVAGLKLVKTSQVAVGSVWVGDSTKYKVRELQAFTATAGWEATDFRDRVITLLGVRRLHKYFKSNEAGAFVYDQFADIKNAIVIV